MNEHTGTYRHRNRLSNNVWQSKTNDNSCCLVSDLLLFSLFVVVFLSVDVLVVVFVRNLVV